MQTDTGTIRSQDETHARRAPRAVLAALAATAVVATIAVAVPAARHEVPTDPVTRPVAVDTSLPAIGFSHVPPHGYSHPHGPRQAPKQGALGG